MSSQLLFRNESSSNLADAYGKHFVRYTGRPAKKIYPTFSFNKNHQIYIQYNTLMSVILIITHFLVVIGLYSQ